MDNKYLNTILDCMDGYQKDYYKQCTLVDILLSDSWNQKKERLYGCVSHTINLRDNSVIPFVKRTKASLPLL